MISFVIRLIVACHLCIRCSGVSTAIGFIPLLTFVILIQVIEELSPSERISFDSPLQLLLIGIGNAINRDRLLVVLRLLLIAFSGHRAIITQGSFMIRALSVFCFCYDCSMSWNVDIFEPEKYWEINILKESLGKTTCHFIGDELRPLYVDALTIYYACLFDDAVLSKLGSLHYLLMPMTSAIEATLFKLADELGIKYSKQATIGTVFSKNQVSSLVTMISDMRQKLVVEEQLGFLGGFIQAYRNNPIHNGMELFVENKQQLQNKLAAIFDRIKSLVESLERAGLLNFTPYNRAPIGTASNWG
jgi:hypothetical protein